MNDFRIRQKDNFIKNATWKQLYVLSNHWKSDILFYKEDLQFLQHLMDTYFLYLSKKENIDLVLEMEVKLIQVEKQCNNLLQQITSHVHHLAELIDDPFIYVSDTFRAEHEQLEDTLAQFVKDFRTNKKEIFALTKRMIKEEELLKKRSVLKK